MKNYMRTAGISAILALMIPISAYAAANNTRSTVTPPVTHMSTVDSEVQSDQTEKHFDHHRHGGQGWIMNQEVLDLLKLDQNTLRDKLIAGQTLAQIAEAQGVSRENLKKALTTAFTKKQDEMKQKFTKNLDLIVDKKFHPGKWEGKGHSGGYIIGKGKDLSALANKLGVSTQDLQQTLESGKTLADVAKEKGVDVQTLIDVQKQVIVERINQAVKDGRLTQEQADKQNTHVDQIAKNVVNGKIGSRFHCGHDDRSKDDPGKSRE